MHCSVRRNKQMHKNPKYTVFVYVSVCVHTWMTVCLHKCVTTRPETRDALQLLVPSDEGASSSDIFHLPSLNLNLPGCSTSNSLRTNGIYQQTSKRFFLCCNKGVQMCIHSGGKRSFIFSFCPLYEARLRVLECNAPRENIF